MSKRTFYIYEVDYRYLDITRRLPPVVVVLELVVNMSFARRTRENSLVARSSFGID